MFRLGQEKKVLRKHQVKAIDQIRSSFGKGNRRVVCQGPTGFGKSVIAAKIITSALEKGNRVIFTAPAIVLINQTVAAFEAEGISGIGVLQSKHPRTDIMAPVQIASVQTLAKRDIPPAALVIVDEAHLQHQVINKLIDARANIYFLGLTATPWAKGMGTRWDDLVTPVRIGELIDQELLSKFTVYAPSVPDLSGVKTMAGDFNEKQLEEIMGENKLVADVVETWLGQGENRPTLCFAVNCAHAKALHDRFVAFGVSSAYCDAYTDSAEMARIERHYRQGKIKVVCSVRKLTTGLDWPVGCIIDAAPTKSEILHVQKIGRGLRVNPGTEDLIILDHASNTLRLGLVTDIHYDQLDTTKKGEKQKKTLPEKLPRACPKCGVLFTGLVCPACGRERKPVSGVETADGKLIRITGGKKTFTKNEKQQFWGMARWIDNERQKNGKLALALYKNKFGVWPRMLDARMIPPDNAFMNYEKSRRIAYAKARHVSY